MTVLPASGVHVVYRLFDLDRQLLYVGRSGQLRERLDDHSRCQPWWDEVTGFSWELCADRAESIRRESEAIRVEGPKYNVRRGDEIHGPMLMVACRLPRDLVERLQVAAHGQGRSVSDLHRALLARGLDGHARDSALSG